MCTSTEGAIISTPFIIAPRVPFSVVKGVSTPTFGGSVIASRVMAFISRRLIARLAFFPGVPAYQLLERIPSVAPNRTTAINVIIVSFRISAIVHVNKRIRRFERFRLVISTKVGFVWTLKGVFVGITRALRVALTIHEAVSLLVANKFSILAGVCPRTIEQARHVWATFAFFLFLVITFIISSAVDDMSGTGGRRGLWRGHAG